MEAEEFFYDKGGPVEIEIAEQESLFQSCADDENDEDVNENFFLALESPEIYLMHSVEASTCEENPAQTKI